MTFSCDFVLYIVVPSFKDVVRLKGPSPFHCYEVFYKQCGGCYLLYVCRIYLIPLVPANPCLIWMKVFTCHGVAWFTFYHLFCDRSHFFGDVSPKRDPAAYLKYICSIYDYYQKEYCTFDKGQNSYRSQTPLVVNTSGWVKGNHTFYIFTAHKLLKIYLLSWYSFNGFFLAFQV
jgi:hypothetical protein